jgi:hypothetical protein
VHAGGVYQILAARALSEAHRPTWSALTDGSAGVNDRS